MAGARTYLFVQDCVQRIHPNDDDPKRSNKSIFGSLLREFDIDEPKNRAGGNNNIVTDSRWSPSQKVIFFTQ
jgi:hypothetical protein